MSEDPNTLNAGNTGSTGKSGTGYSASYGGNQVSGYSQNLQTSQSSSATQAPQAAPAAENEARPPGKDITTAEFVDDVIKGSNNQIVLVDFWAPWCGPCKQFAPVFEAASELHPDVVFGKVNTEDQQELASEFQIRSIPTLMIFREQIGVFMQPGALAPNDLEDVISKVRELDMNHVRAEVEKQDSETA
jgi:thioredoxin 1